MPPETTQKLAKTTSNHPEKNWYYLYKRKYIFFTKNKLFFGCVVLMLNAPPWSNFWGNLDLKLIILEIKWNSAQKSFTILFTKFGHTI